MDMHTVGEVTKWIKETDLAEVVYRKNGQGFEVRTEDAPLKAALPACSYAPVASPAVGIYRSSDAGKTRKFGEGTLVQPGDDMGYVEVLAEKKPVTAAVKGYIRIIAVEDGKPVQYGQPLFFLELA